MQPTFALDELKTEDLFYILDCETDEELDVYFADEIPRPPTKKFFKRYPHHPKSQALKALEESSVPLDIYWVVISTVSLGIAALPLTLSVLGITGIFGLYNYHSSYTSITQTRQDNIRFFRLHELKNQVADVLIAREKSEIKNPALSEIKPQPFRSHLNLEEKPSVFQAIIRGSSVSLTLMLAYYLSTAWIFETIGLIAVLSAMTGPIGLTIAAGFAVSVGIFLAFQYYEARESAIFIKQEKEKLTHETKTKRDVCYQLKAINHTQTLFNSQEVRPSCAKGDLTPRLR